mmetsp:Transcript_40712/g.129403  ORF Transcript_40712/g.129403 Transcript_40712/m.129403 type:complete len:738 (-) Transcript_40712:37-2250(-)
MAGACHHAMVLAGLLAHLAAAANGPTPVEKVITLMTKLKIEVEMEGKAEAATYKEFSCWCQDGTLARSDSVREGESSIARLASDMDSEDMNVKNLQKELMTAMQKKGEQEADLQSTSVQCQKDEADYEAANVELTKAIDSLTSAIDKLEGAKGGAFIAIRDEVGRSLALADALKLANKTSHVGNTTALLQSGVDPSDPDYKYHSQNIIDILKNLQGEFTDKKTTADSEWKKTKETCTNKIGSLTDGVAEQKKIIGEKEEDIGMGEAKMGLFRGDLVKAEASLKDDQLYLKDITATCEARAKTWDQRTQQRADELTALTKALEILQKGVKSADQDVNERAFLQQPKERRVNSSAVEQARNSSAAEQMNSSTVAKGAQAPAAVRLGHGLSFLQSSPAGGHRAVGVAKHDHDTALVQTELKQRQGRALEVLRQAGGRLKSTALSALALRVAGDPFEKVKTLIQKLVERLLQEAAAEATKKGFCDTELGTAIQDRTFRFKEAVTLNAEIRQLEAKKAKLEMEIEDLKEAIKDLKAALKKASEVRREEKDDNLKDIETAQGGLSAITGAIQVLNSFYSDAAKAALFEVKASPIDEENPGAASGNYKGKQEASKGIIGLLEIIKSDFVRTIRVTTKQEKEAAEEFVKFDRASNVDISKKSTKQELNEDDLETTKNSIKSKMRELEDNMGLTDQAVKEIEDLKPMCIDSGMSYEDRVKKREAEMEALKKALCILDTEGVEEECK